MNMLAKLLLGRNDTIASGVDGYRVFTRKFDVVVGAGNLDDVLGRDAGLETATDAAWRELQVGMSDRTTKLNVIAMERAAHIRCLMTEKKRQNTVATILIDRSGSMRGQKMICAAASADMAQALLRELGIAVEVLGFTTVRWQGGKSRRLWKLIGKPRNPGRLCDLLHVIYRSADDSRMSTGDWAFRQMLRPDLPKENVDGEAVEWAVTRLRSRPEQRKILAVISDGAPVDDSTLQANSLEYLEDHLHQVIAKLQHDGGIYMAAVEMGDLAQRHYPKSFKADAPNDIGTALLTVLEQALTDRAETMAATSPAAG